MNSDIKKYCDNLILNFSEIPEERKFILRKITDFISSKRLQGKAAHLIYICTHNSRRSHFGQVWASLAANYYGINSVYSHSGGTESTRFNENAINALKKIGFIITQQLEEDNPVFEINFEVGKNSIKCFSKIFDHQSNPQKEFLAILTCEEAEKECPFVPGAALRIACSYEDPKIFDGTNLQEKMYDSRCRQIALETFYVFSLLK